MKIFKAKSNKNHVLSTIKVKCHGLYKEWSNLTRWKLLTLILKVAFSFEPPFYWIRYFVCDSLTASVGSFCKWSWLFIFFLPEKSWLDVKHMVYRRLSRVYLISIDCFWTRSFWIFLSLNNIFYESVYLCFSCSFLSF